VPKSSVKSAETQVFTPVQTRRRELSAEAARCASVIWFHALFASLSNANLS